MHAAHADTCKPAQVPHAHTSAQPPHAPPPPPPCCTNGQCSNAYTHAPRKLTVPSSSRSLGLQRSVWKWSLGVASATCGSARAAQASVRACWRVRVRTGVCGVRVATRTCALVQRHTHAPPPKPSPCARASMLTHGMRAHRCREARARPTHRATAPEHLAQQRHCLRAHQQRAQACGVAKQPGKRRGRRPWFIQIKRSRDDPFHTRQALNDTNGPLDPGNGPCKWAMHARRTKTHL